MCMKYVGTFNDIRGIKSSAVAPRIFIWGGLWSRESGRQKFPVASRGKDPAGSLGKLKQFCVRHCLEILTAETIKI